MNSTMDDEHQANSVYALVYGSVMALGLPLNAVSLWILLRHHSLTSTVVVFMVNLAVSDLLLTISLPLRIYFYATDTWPLGIITCVSAMILFCTNIHSSAIFITFISVDRLLAVVYPVRSRYLRTSSNAWRAAALAWVFLFVLNIPHSKSMYSGIQEHNGTVCFEYGQNQTAHIPTMAYVWIMLVFILLVINVVCTSLVSWTLCKHVTDSARVNNKVNIILIFVMSFVMFTICFLPVRVALITQSTAITPLVCLATVNCCLDPLLYYFSLDAFWKKKENVDLAREGQSAIS